MAKRTHDHKIHQSTFRQKAAGRKEPYWRSMGRGRALGFRKRAATDPGAWVARWATDELQDGEKGDGSRRYKTVQKVLGRVQGAEKLHEEELNYEEAEAKALQWFEQCGGGVTKSGTVADAARNYVKNQRGEKGDRAADFSDKLFERVIYDTPLGRKKIDELTTAYLEHWRDSLVTKSCNKNSANRILRSVKAVLSYGFQRGMCPTDAAWRRVKPLKGKGAADGNRVVYLTPKQRQLLIATCEKPKFKEEEVGKKPYSNVVPPLADFIRALLHTGARPLAHAELPVAKVADFDPKQKTLTLRNYKGDGTERKREVPLNDQAVEFFKRMAKDKLPGAYLLTRDGEPWQQHQWARGIRAAVELANRDITEPADRIPLDTVAYTMRHCAITDRLKAGISTLKVAKDAGTSVVMIEKNYAKFMPSDDREKLASVVAF